MVFFLALHSLLLGDVTKAVSSLDMLIRFSAIIIFYLYFKTLIKNQAEDLLFTIAKISFYFLIFNTFLGVIGLGYPMYGIGESGIGTKGLIFAGNEIGAALIVSGAIVSMKYLEDNNIKYFFVSGILLLISSIFLASKVSLLGSIILFFFFPLLKAFKNMSNFKLPKSDFINANIILVTVPILAIVGIYYTLYEINLIDRLSYFYEKLDLITLIFSSRNIWAEEAYNAFINHYSFIEYLFGSGRGYFEFISDDRLVEIDPIDFLMNYGIIGLLITFGIIFFILFETIIKRKLNKYSIYVIFTIFLLLGISSTAGHVFNSGTAGFLIAILLALGSYRNKQKLVK
ncbi:O-antigen ligase family protein [Poseidonibacter antarcticus]|uniref:O-antigen ligase family protein n=1 Tax=Poseidonibacter antarcticus TaxID=2478538 RepID=UPI0013CE92EA|nr:O-antigen ligase family protein [Poseidonibacter antarcticus]